MGALAVLFVALIIGYFLAPMYYKNISDFWRKRIRWRENLLEKFHLGKELSLQVFGISSENFDDRKLVADTDGEKVKFERYKQLSEKALEKLFSEKNLARIKSTEKFDINLLKLLLDMTEMVEALKKICSELEVKYSKPNDLNSLFRRIN